MLADFIDRDDVRAGEISRMGHLYYIGTEFSNLHYLVRQRSRRVNEDVFHFGSNMFASRTPRIPSEALQLPPKRIAEQLVEAYFTKINRGFPIVDEEEFMSFYHNPGPNKKLSPLLLNAVFVVGSHVLSATREDIRAMRPTFFRRTKTLFDSRSEQHREVYLQAALLLTWYCDNLEEVVSNSWYWIGVASRTAFGMGMHRDVTPSGLNRSDKRRWVRWWWTMFQFDVMVSTSHGRPQAM
jgi:transcriptional regulatory protein AMDR